MRRSPTRSAPRCRPGTAVRPNLHRWRTISLLTSTVDIFDEGSVVDPAADGFGSEALPEPARSSTARVDDLAASGRTVAARAGDDQPAAQPSGYATHSAGGAGQADAPMSPRPTLFPCSAGLSVQPGYLVGEVGNGGSVAVNGDAAVDRRQRGVTDSSRTAGRSRRCPGPGPSREADAECRRC